MGKADESKLIPPYLPFDTFVEAIAHFRATAVPGRIDKSAFPSSMHRLQRGQVQSALRYLGMIDSDDHTKPELRKLVSAHGTDGWAKSLTDHVFAKFHSLTGDLDLETATTKQLDEKFQAAGLSGQMLMKAVRFYLAVMTASGLTFSPHLAARRSSTAPKNKKKTVKKSANKAAPATKNTTHVESGKPEPLPEGIIEFPIPLGAEAGSCIRVPRDITTKQLPLVRAILGAVEALAMQNSEEE